MAEKDLTHGSGSMLPENVQKVVILKNYYDAAVDGAMNSGDTVKMFVAPAGMILCGASIKVSTAFGTGCTMSLGDGTNTLMGATAVDALKNVACKPRLISTGIYDFPPVSYASATNISLTISGAATGSTGKITVYLECYMLN